MKSSLKYLLAILVFGGVLFVGYHAWTQHVDSSDVEVNSVDGLVDFLLQMREEQTLEVEDVDFGDDTQLNVLFLGLDERKEETENKDAHCDAIHMFTFDLTNWTIHITSVPRGTVVYIPGGPYGDNEYYMANACAFAGLDYGISQIERIVGVKADYVATVGFSQVYGILRLLDLPTTESLQWLRHRQSYQIGEPQRTANQETFMKDLIINHIQDFSSDLTIPLQYVLYSFVDTDMPFSVAHTLLKGYIDNTIQDRPDDITTQLKPYYETQEIHFDFDNYQEQLSTIIDYLRPYLSKEDLSEMPIEQVQTILIDFINGQMADHADLTDIVDKQLWLQVEDDVQREDLQYSVIEEYAQQLLDAGKQSDAVQIVTDYVLEKELLGDSDWEQRGRDLLERVLQ